ncbi:hypothetical protein ACFL6M_07255 [Candidatus Eisenbacteria bacterium]|uniref:Uncharacterized protein n=1 Tax=Eiseniibacteriota bacterium TaxID=2212470 RepID=A0ABV6YMH2_UNCEI
MECARTYARAGAGGIQNAVLIAGQHARAYGGRNRRPATPSVLLYDGIAFDRFELRSTDSLGPAIGLYEGILTSATYRVRIRLDNPQSGANCDQIDDPLGKCPLRLQRLQERVG